MSSDGGSKKIVAVAAISACTTVVVTELLRRLVSTASKKTGADVDDVDYDNVNEGLPELGKKLQEREFSFPGGGRLMNNGSYGSVPNRVLRAQMRMMEERESCPPRWYRSMNLDLYRSAIKVVAEFVGAKPSNLVLVENATTAANCILKSFKFQSGDKVLISNLIYGAVRKTVDLVMEFNPGVSLVEIDLPFTTTVSEILAAFSKALEENPEIKMVMVDHITSASAIRMPVRELVRLCHSHNAIIVVDGAHCPGQLQLNLEELGADFYFGNNHKWLFNPRGCSPFYIHPKNHSWIRTAISSRETFTDDLQSRFSYIGTRDNIPYFTAKHSIHFHNYLGGLERITAYNTELVDWAAEMLSTAWKTTWIKLEAELHAPFMRMVLLPQTPKLASYLNHPDGKHELMKDISKLGVYVAVTTDGKQLYFRISAQVYNYKEEYYRVRDAFVKVLEIQN